MMNQYLKILPMIVGIGLIAACGSTNPPTQQLTETRMVIEQAEQVGAQEYAPLELRDAGIKLQQARDAVEEKEYEKAIRLLDHARIDAEVAQVKALSAKSQKASEELRESIRVLREELERKNK
ncbi:MAG: DUF4398 domain-containing protein [Cyclonatronaceae bacterium]